MSFIRPAGLVKLPPIPGDRQVGGVPEHRVDRLGRVIVLGLRLMSWCWRGVPWRATPV